MEYLKPVELLHAHLRHAGFVIGGLLALLGVCLVAIPKISALGNPVIIQTEAGPRLASVAPWKLSIARMEGFTRAYLGSRFDWSGANFSEKRESLRQLLDDPTFLTFNASLNAFETLAKEQNARSYYVLEQLQFANADETIRAQVTRVLRIKNVAFATPLAVTLTYENAPLTEANPYGLHITGAKEIENETH